MLDLILVKVFELVIGIFKEKKHMVFISSFICRGDEIDKTRESNRVSPLKFNLLIISRK